MAVTGHDVARLAGVSQATVSRSLRGDGRVSAATREKVTRAAAALGYVTDQLGRGLSTRSTGQIALVVHPDHPLHPTLVEPLHDTLAAAGLRMVLLVERDADGTVDRLFDRSVDGAVLTSPLLPSSLEDRLHDRGIPFVHLNRSGDAVRVDSVSADNRRGGAAVARLFLELGHTRIGAVLGPERTDGVRGRETGFLSVVEGAAGVSVSTVRPGSLTYSTGYQGLTDLLDGPTPPTAVFCADDTVAIGALNAALRRGVAVPAELSVVGFDDLEMAAWPCFGLTTVSTDTTAMARRAASVLLARLARPDAPPVQEIFPTRLVLRDTHAAPRPRRN